MSILGAVGEQTVQEAAKDASELIMQGQTALSPYQADLAAATDALKTIAGVLAKGYTITITVAPKK